MLKFRVLLIAVRLFCGRAGSAPLMDSSLTEKKPVIETPSMRLASAKKSLY